VIFELIMDVSSSEKPTHIRVEVGDKFLELAFRAANKRKAEGRSTATLAQALGVAIYAAPDAQLGDAELFALESGRVLHVVKPVVRSGDGSIKLWDDGVVGVGAPFRFTDGEFWVEIKNTIGRVKP
jgi:hypothetical protein